MSRPNPPISVLKTKKCSNNVIQFRTPPKIAHIFSFSYFHRMCIKRGQKMFLERTILLLADAQITGVESLGDGVKWPNTLK